MRLFTPFIVTTRLPKSDHDAVNIPTTRMQRVNAVIRRHYPDKLPGYLRNIVMRGVKGALMLMLMMSLWFRDQLWFLRFGWASLARSVLLHLKPVLCSYCVRIHDHYVNLEFSIDCIYIVQYVSVCDVFWNLFLEGTVIFLVVFGTLGALNFLGDDDFWVLNSWSRISEHVSSFFTEFIQINYMQKCRLPFFHSERLFFF